MTRIISIEGNIGSGKSTLVDILKNELSGYMKNNTTSNQEKERYNNIIFMEEPVDIWMTIKDKNGDTMLSKFYRDKKKYAFSFQMMAYISRISLLKKAVKENPDSILICERSVFTDKNVFAKMLYDDELIEEVNYQIYLKWFEEFIEEVPVSALVYVKAQPEVSHSRVIKRARNGETIPLEYLVNCHKYHEEWIIESKNENIPVLVLDGNTNKDDPSQYKEWVESISTFITDI